MTGSNSDNTSSFVMTSLVTPLIIMLKLSWGRSNQPHRRDLPVVAPNSCPSLCSFSPLASKSSVGNGPLPTRVQYALVMPITSLIFEGAMPSPLQTPLLVVLEEVTKG